MENIALNTSTALGCRTNTYTFSFFSKVKLLGDFFGLRDN